MQMQPRAQDAHLFVGRHSAAVQVGAPLRFPPRARALRGLRPREAGRPAGHSLRLIEWISHIAAEQRFSRSGNPAFARPGSAVA